MVEREERRWRYQALVWAWLAITLVSAAANVPYVLRDEASAMGRAGELLWVLVPPLWVLVGALITAQKRGSAVGLLMLLPGVGAVNISRPVVALTAAPETVDLQTWVGLYLDNLGWLFLLMPVVALLAVFPTGRPLSDRWRWHPYLIAAMSGFLLVYGAFSEWIGPLDESWRVANPVGFLPDIFTAGWFFLLWTVGLLVITVGALASVVLRYRRAGWRERDQLRWLLFAFGIFAVVYIGEALQVSTDDGQWDSRSLLGMLLPLTIAFIPIAMAVAIQQKRVLDIEVIIRRTVSYSLLTAMLSVVYVSVVVGLQAASQRLTGDDSNVVVAVATLLSVALFNPLRSRTQRFVSRRFFRSDYDAGAVLEGFRRAIDNEIDTDRVSELLLAAVIDALHPTMAGVLSFDVRPTAVGTEAGT